MDLAVVNEEPLLVALVGQRSADLNSVCRALTRAGAESSLRQSTETFAELAMSDAELVHPEREPRLAALLRSGRLREGHAGGPSCVVLAFDSAGERLPLLGQYGKLEKLHAALLRAGVPAQRIAFVGTREARPEAQIFAPGGLAPGFVQRLGHAQLAALQRERYVPTRFMVWGARATPAQQGTLRAWLGDVSTEAALQHELTSREEEALENMMNNMRAIKAVVATASGGGAGQGGGSAAQTQQAAVGMQTKKAPRATTVHWGEGV